VEQKTPATSRGANGSDPAASYPAWGLAERWALALDTTGGAYGPAGRRGPGGSGGAGGEVAALGRVVLVIGGVWLILVVLGAVFQRSLIYLPDRTSPAPPTGVEVVRLDTPDGLTLTAWLVPAEGAAASTVLLAPGNAGNRAGRLPTAWGLAARGHQVLLLEYRGYGGNPGRPHEAGLLADARSAHDHLVARDDVDPAKLVYLGESIGTAVVAALAVERPPAALVLRSPFPELADVAAGAYPFLPVRTLLHDRHPTLEHLAEVDVPVLVVAGERDRIVPPELSRQVAAATGAAYVEVAGADHNDGALFVGEAFLDAVDEHIGGVLGVP
jgi:uncharacterized protein